MKLSLSSSITEEIRNSLHPVNAEINSMYPGDSSQRQPVHTVYGGAQIFKANTSKKMGEMALESLKQYAPDAHTFAKVLGIQEFGDKVYARVLEKLKHEPVEDFRIDFEDGYGNRTDAEEDGHAQSTAVEVAKGLKEGTLPPFIGIRIKPLTDELFTRSIRTLDIFVSTLVENTGHKLPENFFITLPKITAPEQVTALTRIFRHLEMKLDLPPNTLRMELMIETPQSIFTPKGVIALPALVEAAQGRCVGAHFGTYDYTASCGITAAHQNMLHEACNFARHVMQVSLAGTGIALSDGATNLMPVGPHRASSGHSLTSQQLQENQEVVHKVWKLNYEHVRHSLVNAYYQGWDLHPSQLPIRYAAVYTFFLENLNAASVRLKSFMDKAAQATLVGEVFDDAATGQGLLSFFLRGMSCGAIYENEVLQTGLTLDELRSRSFYRILEGRRKNNR
jgi:citrate lyase beta subunit